MDADLYVPEEVEKPLDMVTEFFDRITRLMQYTHDVIIRQEGSDWYRTIFDVPDDRADDFCTLMEDVTAVQCEMF